MEERGMKIASGISSLQNTREMVGDLCAQIRDRMDGTPIDLLLLFVSSSLQPVFDVVLKDLRSELHPRALLACTAEGVLGVGQNEVAEDDPREVERQSAISALALSLPGVVIDTFHFGEDEWSELLLEEGGLSNRLDAGDNLRAFLLMGDPFTTPIVELLQRFSSSFPRAPVIGAMASGMQAPGEVRLAVNQHIHSSGLVGVSLAGDLQVDCVVSQGCRPVGETVVITKAHRNVIEELNGKPALATVQEILAELPLDDRLLVNTNGLHIGRVIDEGKGSYGRGDFLIRSVIQVDKDNGSIAIGDLARAGQTLQFHVRDAKTAQEDLRLLLEGELQLANAPVGAVLFSCAGRGTRLYDEPHRDILTAREILGPVPMAGFFGAGELGPVGQKNFIHSFTLSMALFRSTTEG